MNTTAQLNTTAAATISHLDRLLALSGFSAVIGALVLMFGGML